MSLHELKIWPEHNESILELLKLESRLCTILDTLSNLGVNIDIDFDLLDIVCDLLGVPPDNTDTSICDDTGLYPDDVYCRDWIYHAWDECKHDPDKFVQIIMKEESDASKE